MKELDFSDFAGPKLNAGWIPDPQELVYQSLLYLDGDAVDSDEDTADQLIERLLALVARQHEALAFVAGRDRHNGGLREAQRHIKSQFPDIR